MNSGERPKSFSDTQTRPTCESSFMHPLVTEEVVTVCGNSEVRVEHNLVRNVATGERERAVRLLPPDDRSYVTVVIPVLADGKLLLLGRYRYAINRWSTELPRFACQTSDTGWKHAAAEALWKHAGLKAAKMTLLGAIQPDAAHFATNTIVVLADGCIQHAPRPAAPRELIAGSVVVSTDELGDLVKRGDVACGVTLAALYLHRVCAG